ncbi:type VI secretion system protein [Xenophilus sp. Marseille-Q4582]|uniref:type VI secretion system protein n=1 Tax=Xenophilus sp. Marseille-Q4582 TaxID=2866600 RepID=UPI001CE3CB43|nr:type VI secretion system protein [Xenophilus sp. Marseille-Q4582]
MELMALGAMALGLGLLAWLLRQPGTFDGLSRWQLWRGRLLAARREGHAAPPTRLRALRAALPSETDHAPLWPLAKPAPLRAPPRLLFVGDAAAGLPALLAAVVPEGPAQQALPGEEPFWRWWSLPTLTAIELCPPPPPEEPPQDLLWLHALRTLAQTQPERPLDGWVLCISTALLRADAKVAEPVMQLLARRLHESAALLEQPLPVHVLLTGLQDLPGYATVHDALPGPWRAQALGWCAPAFFAAPGWQEATATWQAALHGLRLSLLAQERPARERHDIHRFVDLLLGLGPGLDRLQRSLRLDRDARTPLRGLYLTAAAPQPAFVQDLFDRFLPHPAGRGADAA